MQGFENAVLFPQVENFCLFIWHKGEVMFKFVVNKDSETTKVSYFGPRIVISASFPIVLGPSMK